MANESRSLKQNFHKISLTIYGQNDKYRNYNLNLTHTDHDILMLTLLISILNYIKVQQLLNIIRHRFNTNPIISLELPNMFQVFSESRCNRVIGTHFLQLIQNPLRLFLTHIS